MVVTAGRGMALPTLAASSVPYRSTTCVTRKRVRELTGRVSSISTYSSQKRVRDCEYEQQRYGLLRNSVDNPGVL